MQVHQWLNGCEYGPPVMMSFDEKGRLRARILREIHKNNKFVLEGWTRKSFENRWVEVAIDIVNKNDKSDVEIFLGGKSVLKLKALIIPGGGLYFKAGIYHEGQNKRTLPTYAILN